MAYQRVGPPPYNIQHENKRLGFALETSNNKAAAEIATDAAKSIENEIKNALIRASCVVHQIDNDISDEPEDAIAQHRLQYLDEDGKRALCKWADVMRHLLAEMGDFVIDRE